MPTKLKAPIVIEITNIENAVTLLMDIIFSKSTRSDARYHEINLHADDREVLDQLARQLQKNGIDYKTWVPK